MRPGPRSGDTKTGRFLALVVERHGPLAGLPEARVSPIATELAGEVGLNTGAARKALRQRRAHGSGREPVMKAALLLIGALAVLGLIVHCFRSGGRLPSRRVRSVRMRLHLRRRPGRGVRQRV